VALQVCTTATEHGHQNGASYQRDVDDLNAPVPNYPNAIRATSSAFLSPV